MKEWILIKDLIGVAGLATTPQGVLLHAKRENWKRRRVLGVKGNVFEYYIGDMPKDVQKALGFNNNPTIKPKIDTSKIGRKELEQLLEQALEMIDNALTIAKQPQEPEQPPQDEIKLNNPEKRLIRYFRQSSVEGQDAILNVAETMAAMQGKREEEKYAPEVA